MAAKPEVQARKCDYTWPLINSHDFGILEEVHGTPGKEDSFHVPSGCVALWSHMSAARAGVGIVLQQSFLNRFAPTKAGDFLEIEPGRIARLTLRGPEGELDIYAIYLSTGFSPSEDLKQRQHSIALLQKFMRNRDSVLSILAGDWNFVTSKHDRWCYSGGKFTGEKDLKENEQAVQNLHNTHGAAACSRWRADLIGTATLSIERRGYAPPAKPMRSARRGSQAVTDPRTSPWPHR